MVEPAFMDLGAVYVPSYDAISTLFRRVAPVFTVDILVCAHEGRKLARRLTDTCVHN
jgi:hypothetical protein